MAILTVVLLLPFHPSEEELRGVCLLVFANKQDVKGAMNGSQVVSCACIHC